MPVLKLPQTEIKLLCLPDGSSKYDTFMEIHSKSNFSENIHIVRFEDAVELIKNLETNMREDREASQKFLIECEKYGILPELREGEEAEESPFFGGNVPWM